MNNIPFFDLSRGYRAVSEEIDECLRTVAGSGSYILGENVSALEREVAEYLGVRHAVTVASGTDALYLALAAAGISPGDEVISTPFTFAATLEVIEHTGAACVLVDIDPRTYNIDPGAIEAAITPSTRAILPVHMFGLPADMETIRAIAQRHELELVEDCAQSMGATINGKAAGSFGTAGAFSFYPTKTLGCFGDGGMVTTDSEAVASRLRKLRNHGIGTTGEFEMIGYNSRLDEMQAAVLRIKLPLLAGYIERRRQIAAYYNERLAPTVAITPEEADGGNHSFGYYTIRVPNRDSLRSALQERGIGCAVYYARPLHRFDCYAAFCRQQSLETTEHVAGECLSLPMYPELTDAEVECVARNVVELLGGGPAARQAAG